MAPDCPRRGSEEYKGSQRVIKESEIIPEPDYLDYSRPCNALTVYAQVKSKL